MANLSTTKIFGDLTVTNILKSYEILRLDGTSVVYEDRNITAGVGMAGGGSLSSNITISMGTPGALTASTGDTASGSTHTHSISTASAVGLSNSSANAAGTSVSLARADHTHAITGFSLSNHNHSLDSLNNVTISSNTNGELLRWNGSAWVNNTLAEAGIQPSDSDLTSIAGLTGTSGLLRKTAANTWSLDTTGYTTNTGTVTSVAMTVPTGLSVSGTPIATSGTLALTFASGYSIPTTSKQGQWDGAVTHISSNGSDHSYINQSVTTSATPQFARLGLGVAAGSTAPLTIRINDSGEFSSGMIALENLAAGEASIRFNSTSTGANSWFLGLNQGDLFKLGYFTSFTDATTKFSVTTGGAVAATSFNSITGLSVTSPNMDGAASSGSGTTVARADHVHPTDTTRMAANHAASGVSTALIGNWNSAYSDTSNATSANTASRIVKRDTSGNFSAGTITLSGKAIVPEIWFNASEGGANISHNDNNNETRAGYYSALDGIIFKSDNLDKAVLKSAAVDATKAVYTSGKVGMQDWSMEQSGTGSLLFVYNG